jgi:Xaa-Pro aminopeptidase
MVVTVEPGIYIPIGSDCDKMVGIAILSDDILITKRPRKFVSRST